LRHDLEERYKCKLRDFERRRASSAANHTWSANNNNYYYYYDVHYPDNRRHSSGEDESHESLVNPAYSDGKVSERKSRNGTPAENYHLDNYHIPKKVRRMDDVGHKSPRSKNAVVTCGAVVNRTQKKDKKPSSSARMASSPEPNLNFEEFFPDGTSMNSVVQAFVLLDEDGLSIHDASDAFDFGN